MAFYDYDDGQRDAMEEARQRHEKFEKGKRATALTGGRKSASSELAAEYKKQAAHEKQTRKYNLLEKQQFKQYEAMRALEEKHAGKRLELWPEEDQAAHRKADVAHEKAYREKTLTLHAMKGASAHPVVRREVAAAAKAKMPHAKRAVLMEQRAAHHAAGTAPALAPKPLLRGKKGGMYYLSKTGQKVYAGKR